MAYLKNIAVVGVASSAGRFAVDELLKGGRHTITALTRKDSPNPVPAGVKAVKVDYDDHDALVAALQGQDALFINMNAAAPPEIQMNLIQAAADAKVPYVLPNEWNGDVASNKKYGEEIFLGQKILAARKRIEDLGVSSWIGVSTSFWYEFSLGGGPDRYGFDFATRTVTFFDDGEQKINTTTWPQCGRAVANLLSLKIKPDDAQDTSVTLEQFRNRPLWVSSFLASQKDMFAAVLRVTDTKPEDWTIRHEESAQRYREGVEAFQVRKDLTGFVRAMYARVFYPNGEGAFEKRHELDNERLGLPKEDLDEFTKLGIEMAKNDSWNSSYTR